MSEAETSAVRPVEAPLEKAGPTAEIARRLGPYAIVRPLGHGGMASVYEAVHIGLGKRVALKVMAPNLAQHETTAARFVREGRAVAKVRHPHVVEVFDVGAHDGVPYLVMELLEGLDLAEYLKCNARLPLQETLDIMLPVISAVSAAHEAGIVHRDLKPANVFLAKDRHGKVNPKVVDFGISTFMEKDGDIDLTQTQTMLGTVRYMSPEQTRGAKYADARSDQYSLGVMLYLCTTGHPPFVGEGVYETIHAIRNAPLVAPSTHAPGLPPSFDAILGKAMARDPQSRFASVAELGRALLPFARRKSSASWEREFTVPIDLQETAPDPSGDAAAVVARGTEDPTGITTVAPTDRTVSRRRILFASLVLGAAGVALAFALLGSPKTPAPPSPAAQVTTAATATPVEPPTPTDRATPTAPSLAPALASSPAPSVDPPKPAAAASAKATAHPTKTPWHPPPGATKPPTGANGSPILE